MAPCTTQSLHAPPRAALDGLPRLDCATARASACNRCAPLQAFDEVRRKKWKDFYGEPAGPRTQDPRLKRAMLYQLSYRLTECEVSILPLTIGLCLERKYIVYRVRGRVLRGLRSMMVSLRFEPVEMISMGHSEMSSRYWRYRLASAGSCLYVVAPDVVPDHPLNVL